MNATEERPDAAPSTALPMAAKTPGIRKTAKAATASTGAADASARVIKPIPKGKAHLAQYKRHVWLVFADEDSQPEDFENSAAWVLAGVEFAMYDRVEIVTERRWIDSIVCDTGQGHARVKVLQVATLPSRQPGVETRCPPGYEIRKGGPDEEPWIVVRLSDGWTMNANQFHRTHEEALTWLLASAIFRYWDDRS